MRPWGDVQERERKSNMGPEVKGEGCRNEERTQDDSQESYLFHQRTTPKKIVGVVVSIVFRFLLVVGL